MFSLAIIFLFPARFSDFVPECSPQVASSLFFQYNEALRPPYSVLVDTNFINHTISKRLEMVQAMMDCLYAKVSRRRTMDGWCLLLFHC